mmetsp:Transcript_6211/g.9062  ORF Transcript_6211/g.9062 Transcript_6211/m.9062 type:complete len:584 (-) Transcript_6211:147-1898(-)|eukprot:CAMPEP_0196821850 /NCGR_PEP_ID=MMETSP1362-20130617/81187_1 /TAXON_ID=163516 /ORGANISM="Leptocylindrus danicus, Strain CCMP1856" /LENGTH=583 /DNA_ID=CAMNT_0042201203 /DNA_START=54 /DNA_END=1805 /DNA_ORIENTATION=+
MIIYDKGIFGAKLLLRIHGSAAYKATVPALVAVGVYLILSYHFSPDTDALTHPYAVGALVSSVSFILIFRANFGYQRYWEGATSIHQMTSKWQDAVVLAGVFHYQSTHYNKIKPPCFFDHPKVNFRDGWSRNRISMLTSSHMHSREGSVCSDAVPVVTDLEMQTTPHANSNNVHFMNGNKGTDKDDLELPSADVHANVNGAPPQSSPSSPSRRKSRFTMLRKTASINAISLNGTHPLPARRCPPNNIAYNTMHNSAKLSSMFEQHGLNNVGSGEPFVIDQPPFLQHSEVGMFGASHLNGGVSGTPSLFLQELAHLASLLNAVALSTLRNEIETAKAPLRESPVDGNWPPDDTSDMKRNKGALTKLKEILLYWFWLDRTPESREAMNAEAPLEVIGGVSQGEIDCLQRARGASAKVNLAWIWLMEFITREHLAGSTGAVGPPIISRIYQFLSDGCVGYNQARKISFIPFPFPHAQISLLALLLLTFAVPLLTLEYVKERWIGSLLTFAVTECLFGLHEVARELENPFRNVPNELPLLKLQAQFNEALRQIYGGYHPDHFWCKYEDNDGAMGNHNGDSRQSLHEE